MSVRERPQHATVTRAVRVPDGVRIARSLRAPELGPNILFLSGGSALRALSRRLKHHTHNSVHLITPFDSGGSSAALRDAFDMLSVGDLRNRLMALADESVKGSPAIYDLFSYRMDKQGQPESLQGELSAMVSGEHPLVDAVPMPMQRIVRTHLRYFAEAMPPDFNLRGASIGNLILAGGYLQNEGDIDSVIFTFSKLVEVRGLVRPTVEDPLHLVATLADGTRVVGQHNMTGKETKKLTQPIVDLSLVQGLDEPSPAEATLPERTRRVLEKADLICYPIGSFFSSVAANLLPTGVGSAIAAARCPKLYIPNTGADPEQLGHDAASCVDTLVRLVRRDAGQGTPLTDAVDLVLVDSRRGQYARPLDLPALRDRGLSILDTDLASDDNPAKLDPQKLTDALISVT